MSRDPTKHKAAREAWRSNHKVVWLYLAPADIDALTRARRDGETTNACIKRLLRDAAPAS